jgi:hypothetical protein
MRDVTPIEKVILEKESDTIGGMVILLWGEQGAGKTMALTRMVEKDIEHQRIPLWKGQTTCQWLLPAAQGLPITIWMHEKITDYEFFLTGSRRKNLKKQMVDVTDKEGLDVEIKTYETQEELVENLEIDRVNVYYIPGAGGNEKQKYYYQKQNYFLDKALNNRDYGDHVTITRDEISNEASSMQKGDFYDLQMFMLPSEWEDFRKNKVSMRGAGHSTSDVNYKLHKVKATGTVYMQGGQVHSRHSKLDQGIVNNMDRGEFVVPGFEVGEFAMPKLPDKVFDWMPETNDVRLRMSYEADIPDVRPNNLDIDEWVDSQPFSKDHLDDLIDADEASEIIGITSRVVKRKFQKGELPGIKLNGKWFTSMSALVNEEEVPS